MADPYSLLGQPQNPYLNVGGKQPLNPYATDQTAKVSLKIKGVDYTNVKQYSYDSDLLTLGDPFAATISNVEGSFSGKINPGDDVQLFIADPNVNGGTRNLLLTGIVTDVDATTDHHSGNQIMIRGADLGWHLNNNCGPLFQRLRGLTYKQLLQKTIDPAWGIKGPRGGNFLDLPLRLGAAGVIPANVPADTFIPPIQFEPGQMIGDTLIAFAKRIKLLVNVSADGFLQFFAPDYKQQTRYVLHHHERGNKAYPSNNVQHASLRQSISGLYTEVTCVGQVAVLPPVPSAGNPNEGKRRGKFNVLNALPFPRRITFADADQMDKPTATARAQWKWQRGQFDSWIYEATVRGHSQIDANGMGHFYTPSTMIAVHDTELGVDSALFISAIRYNRDMTGGETTTITMRKPNLLGA